jgi:hypothetical protein
LISISINLGPGVIWLGMIFVSFWIALAAFFAGRAMEQITNAREVQRRQRQMLLAPWIKSGPALLPSRVDPGLTLLRNYMPSEEEEEAA